jgi:hypothetical protein
VIIQVLAGIRFLEKAICLLVDGTALRRQLNAVRFRSILQLRDICGFAAIAVADSHLLFAIWRGFRVAAYARPASALSKRWRPGRLAPHFADLARPLTQNLPVPADHTPTLGVWR